MKMQLENASYKIEERQLFSNITADFKTGKLVCVLGPNGVGKSTLFKCMLNILKLTQGTMLLDGTPIHTLSPGELAKQIAYIPQSHKPSFDYRVLDIVLMGVTSALDTFYKQPTIADEQAAFDMLARLNIGHLSEKNYSLLSGGERQLVLIARALMQKGKILVMDEPTASLDFGHQLQVYEEMQKLCEQGYLIFISTHHPEHALSFANKVLVLKRDATYEIGKPLEVITPKLMHELYNIDVVIEKIEKGRNDYYVCVPGK